MNSNLLTLYIGLAGTSGAAARFIIDQYAAYKFPTRLPWAILGINICGTAIFALATLFLHDHSIMSIITTGFCGGFTTFSTVMTLVSLQKNLQLSQRLLFLTINIVLPLGVTVLILK